MFDSIFNIKKKILKAVYKKKKKLLLFIIFIYTRLKFALNVFLVFMYIINKQKFKKKIKILI